jgi:hypothetical protein
MRVRSDSRSLPDGIGLDRRQQFRNHRRRLAAGLERSAAQTGAIPGIESVVRAGIELDVLALGRAGVTDRRQKIRVVFTAT